jgi:hypothetical protein
VAARLALPVSGVFEDIGHFAHRAGGFAHGPGR